jgi:peptidoglycan/xylan/chitin deacetylase (PgdA/CDA1 family)
MRAVLWVCLNLLILTAGIQGAWSRKKKHGSLYKTKKIEQARSKKSEYERSHSKHNYKHSKVKDPASAFHKSGKSTTKHSSSISPSSIPNSISSSSSSSEDKIWNPVEISFEEEYPIWNKSVREVHEMMKFPSVITKCHKKGDLALTFDDGLSGVTLDVIEFLKRENVPATFFIIGQTLELFTIGNRRPAAILESLLENGHELASHSYSHPNFNDYWPEGIECEMNKTAGLFESLIGLRPRFMRPPFGNANEKTIKALHNLGYFIINWNADTNDWLHKNVPEKALLEFTAKVPSIAHLNMIQLQKGPNQKAALLSALDSKIVLMHDILPNIVDYGPKIIAHARALGYSFVTMSECLGGVNPYFN